MGLLVAVTNRWQKARCAPPWLQWSQVQMQMQVQVQVQAQAQAQKREWTV
jgi:hypothetical protein